jgi:uncharacterized Zn finger protein
LTYFGGKKDLSLSRIVTIMECPSNIETTCPKCEEETMHMVLRGKLGKGKGSNLVFDATVKCTVCNEVHHVCIRQRKPVEVPVIISDGDRSERIKLELPGDAEVLVDDEIELDEILVKVTSIEVGGRRVNGAMASEIGTVWTKRFDTIPIKVNLYEGRQTQPEIIPSGPDQEFKVGDMINVKGRPAVIETIKTEDMVVRKGTVQARDIQRIYARLVSTARQRPEYHRPRRSRSHR